MLALAQSVKEINLFKENFSKLPTILALNLEVITHCEINRLNFIVPFEGKKYHNVTEKIILKSKEFLEQINFSPLKYEFLKNDLKALLRYKFNQTSFIIETLNFIKDDYSEIIYTNLHSSSRFFEEEREYINLEEIIKITKFRNIKKIDTGIKNITKDFCYDYRINGLKLGKQKKIIFNNAGYNFKRIIYFLIKHKKKLALPKKNLSIMKIILFRLLGIELYEFVKNKKVEQRIELPIIKDDLKYDHYEISQIIKNQIKNANNYLNDLYQKYKSIKSYFEKSYFELVLTNTNRDIGSILIEAACETKTKSITISHGTISKSYDKLDDIYKKYIAEGVFLSKSEIKAVQTKICKKSLETLNTSGKLVETGNLIFAERDSFINKKKSKILYAVTNKRLPALQIHGVEYFFEFYHNLKALNTFSKNKKIKILVHLHPGAKKNIKKFKKIFRFLEFSTGDISKSLKKSFVTLSFSSTVIEDSLNNLVPVILLDLNKKNYIHFKAELSPLKHDKALYYIDDIDNLDKCIKTIKQSKNINFEEYIYMRKSKENIKFFFKSYL